MYALRKYRNVCIINAITTFAMNDRELRSRGKRRCTSPPNTRQKRSRISLLSEDDLMDRFIRQLVPTTKPSNRRLLARVDTALNGPKRFEWLQKLVEKSYAYHLHGILFSNMHAFTVVNGIPFYNIWVSICMHVPYEGDKKELLTRLIQAAQTGCRFTVRDVDIHGAIQPDAILAFAQHLQVVPSATYLATTLGYDRIANSCLTSAFMLWISPDYAAGSDINAERARFVLRAWRLLKYRVQFIQDSYCASDSIMELAKKWYDQYVQYAGKPAAVIARELALLSCRAVGFFRGTANYLTRYHVMFLPTLVNRRVMFNISPLYHDYEQAQLMDQLCRTLTTFVPENYAAHLRTWRIRIMEALRGCLYTAFAFDSDEKTSIYAGDYVVCNTIASYLCNVPQRVEEVLMPDLSWVDKLLHPQIEMFTNRRSITTVRDAPDTFVYTTTHCSVLTQPTPSHAAAGFLRSVA